MEKKHHRLKISVRWLKKLVIKIYSTQKILCKKINSSHYKMMYLIKILMSHKFLIVKNKSNKNLKCKNKKSLDLHNKQLNHQKISLKVNFRQVPGKFLTTHRPIKRINPFMNQNRSNFLEIWDKSLTTRFLNDFDKFTFFYLNYFSTYLEKS